MRHLLELITSSGIFIQNLDYSVVYADITTHVELVTAHSKDSIELTPSLQRPIVFNASRRFPRAYHLLGSVRGFTLPQPARIQIVVPFPLFSYRFP